MALLIRNSFLLAKAEPGYGDDPGVASSDAIKIVSMEVNPLTGTRVERNLIKGFLGADRQPLTNEHVGVTITFEWGGSGVAATAPRFSPLLQAAGMNLAASAEITGAAAAGGANTLTLEDLGDDGGAPAVSLNPPSDAYLGFPVEITAGTGAGGKGVIVAHDGATRVVTVVPSTDEFVAGADSVYKIPALSMFQPISSFGANSSCTLVAVKDQNVHRIEGFRGSPALNAALNTYGTFTITGIGRYVTPTARGAEAFVHGDQAEPLPVTPRHTRALRFHDYGPCSEGFNFDWGLTTTFRSLLGCEPHARITDRPNPNGTLIIENPRIADKNYFDEAADNSGDSDGTFVVQQGTVETESSIFFCPKTAISGDMSFSESDGIDMMNIPFTALPKGDTGNDETRLIFF
jgi:hypothetical protein